MKKVLFVISAFAMIIPFALEILLSMGVLRDGGSTIEQRRPFYVMLMYTGLAGMILFMITTYPLRLRRN